MIAYQRERKENPVPPTPYQSIVSRIQNQYPEIPFARFIQFFALQHKMPQVIEEGPGRIRVAFGDFENIVTEPIQEWETTIIRIKETPYQFPTPMILPG